MIKLEKQYRDIVKDYIVSESVLYLKEKNALMLLLFFTAVIPNLEHYKIEHYKNASNTYNILNRLHRLYKRESLKRLKLV